MFMSSVSSSSKYPNHFNVKLFANTVFVTFIPTLFGFSSSCHLWYSRIRIHEINLKTHLLWLSLHGKIHKSVANE